MKVRLASSVLIAFAALGFVTPASAGVTINDGTGYSAGIGPDGELYDPDTDVGFSNPAGFDYIRPGTPRDSWGISASTGSAAADQEEFGSFGIVSSTFTSTPSTASVTSSLLNGLSLTQAYNFFAPNILSIQHTVTNATSSVISDIVFRRNVDLDITPTTFDENTTGPLGSNASVVANSYYGFENPDPTVAFSRSCTPSCNEVGDLGAGIDLGLGSLAAGDSLTFAYYYGINQPGQTLDQLFTQAQGLGLSYLIGVQSSENGLYPALGSGSGFLGVSNVGTVAGPVPELAVWLQMILGVGAVGLVLRRSGAIRRPATRSLA